MTITPFPSARPIAIEEEMRSSYLDYAMSVIVSRALPDVRDGLKPVQRRILYAMDELGVRSNQPYKKSARIVGEVMGKYHPHGDSPVYDSLVRLAQDFSLRYPLVDGQGNFGSVDDDPPAAMRYTEARLARIAEEVLVDIDQETVDFTFNFDGSLREPTVLPARLPNLLLNGANGIAVGMATAIPPHNLREVCRAVIHLIDQPDATLESLLRILPGPDFPTRGIIRGREGIISAYSTGKGRVIIEGKVEIEDFQKGGDRKQLIITELPYQVNKATLVERIAMLSRDKQIDGITEVRDESDRTGMRVVVELRRDTHSEWVLNNLYKHTALRSSFFVNMVALVDGAPRTLTLKQILQHYIQFRSVVIVRRSEYQRRKARERAHTLEGLRVALSHLDEVITLIRSASDAEAARMTLIEKFDLTLIQAQAILEMQLRRLAALERQRIDEEYQELMNRIAELDALLTDSSKILSVVKEETQKLGKGFDDKRRTQIITEEVTAFTKAELIPHQPVVVTISERGYIKRIPFATYRLQRRGGRGVRGQTIRDADVIAHLRFLDTHETLLFFTTRGRVYALTTFDIPQDLTRGTRGMPLVNLVPLAEGERVQALIGIPDLQVQGFLLLATRRGIIKRMDFKTLSNIRSNGLIAMILKDKDELVSVRICQESDDILMVSEQGQGIKFPAAEVPSRATRATGGVKGIRLDPSDRIIGADVALPNLRLLTVSRLGFGKLTPVNSFPLHHRGGQGVRAFRITDKTGLVAEAQVAVDCVELMLVSATGFVIRIPLKGIPVLGRNTQGVSVWRPPSRQDYVASVACIGTWEEEEESKPQGKGKTNSGLPRPARKQIPEGPKLKADADEEHPHKDSSSENLP